MSHQLNIKNYIKKYSDIINSELCDEILNEFKDDEWNVARLSGDLVDTTIRNCETIYLFNHIQKNPELRTNLDHEIFKCVSHAGHKYAKDFSTLELREDTGYTLLKYSEGAFYAKHVDSSKNNPRSISCSLILNDNFEGGEFAFLDRRVVIKPKKGDAIVFPSNFMFPHEIMPVTKGTRYAIITWLI